PSPSSGPRGRQPKVPYLHVSLPVQEDVRGLHVPVDDALLVDVHQ
ncbi:eukaryotic translation initiation factor 2-alpha kinase 4, partial [Nannochloropsis gaditana CCMP526]